MNLPDEQLPREFGKYHLIERVATGGMAQLYRAKLYGAGGFEKDLAVKKILPHLGQDEAFIQMFMDEAMITVTLTHGNIAQVLDFGELDGEYFLVMEYVDGIDLQSLIKRSAENYEPVPPALAAHIVQEVCRGLDYAHNKLGPTGDSLQIVHRDVSPQNVLLSFEGQVKLVDFGIARAASRITSTQAGVVKGKVAYMSPEQLVGQNVDGRSDVFSAGIILYELLTHQRPFEGATPQETMALTARGSYIAPQKKNRLVNRKLAAVLKKALEKNPKKRYQSAGKMAAGLASYLHSTGDPPSPLALAQLVRERMPESKPRTVQPTPIRALRKDATPSGQQASGNRSERPELTPAPIVQPAQGTPPPKGAPDVEAASFPAASQGAEPAPKRRTTAPEFPEFPAEDDNPDEEPTQVVSDGEAIAFGLLNLPKEYDLEDPESQRPTDPEFPESKGPAPQPADTTPAGQQPPHKPRVAEGSDAELLSAATQLLTRAKDEPRQAGKTPPGGSSERDELLSASTRILDRAESDATDAPSDRAELLSASTRILDRADGTGEQVAESGPVVDGNNIEVSDQFSAWMDEGEKEAEADFDDEAPRSPRKKGKGGLMALIGVGLVIAVIAAGLLIFVFKPFSGSSTGSQSGGIGDPLIPGAKADPGTSVTDPGGPDPAGPGTDPGAPKTGTAKLEDAGPSGSDGGTQVALATSDPTRARPTGGDLERPTALPDGGAADDRKADVVAPPEAKPDGGTPADTALADVKPDRPKPDVARKKKRTKVKTKPDSAKKRKKKRVKPKPQPDRSKDPKVAVHSKGNGTLRINSEPFSVVYWKEKRLGPTPQMAIKLPVGSHTLTLKNEALGIRKRVRVRIEKGKVHTVFVDLKK